MRSFVASVAPGIAPVVTFALAALGCTPVPPPAPRAAPAIALPTPRLPPVASPSGEERVALFNDLLLAIRGAHVFADATWDNLAPINFSDAVPELRDAFAQAVTSRELADALVRLGNSLHDPHLRFVADPAFETSRATLALPIVLFPEWSGDRLSMVVVESKAKGVAPGDVVMSYAGVAASAFLRTFVDRSNANQWSGIALDVARWMTERKVEIGDADDDASVVLDLKKPDGSLSRIELRWAWGGWHGEDPGERSAPDYDHERCAPGLPTRLYPTYELASHGEDFCLYVSRSAGYAPYPIVRFFSFDFGGPFGAEAEHERLVHFLRELHGVRGVILDLRDNAGGNDPKWVLDWFSPKPYLDLSTHVHVTPRLVRTAQLDITNLDDGWTRALAHAKEGAILSRFIGCEADDCTETRQKPTHRILPVPVALLVGPRCHSACDHFARVFDENGLGPIVGEPSSAGLTVLRTDHSVFLGGKRLGTLGLALSLDYNPFTNTPVEGVPIHVDVPVTWSWARRDVYDKEMVDDALRTLAK